MPPKPLAQNVGAGDEELVAVAGEAQDMVASYEVGCNRLEEVEASGVDAGTVEEVERRIAVSRRQLSATLVRLGSLPAHTPEGALARTEAARGYFALFPVEDPGGVALLRAMFADAERHYGRRQEPPSDV